MSNPPLPGSASPSRRRFFQALTLVPVVAVLPACKESPTTATSAPATPKDEPPYQPAFFNAAEWAFVIAACDRLIPADDIGPGAVESGVPEFLDRHMQTPYASGDIWYMQGPFVDAPSEFGYQGRLALRDILKVGMASTDAHCRGAFDGKVFADLDPAQQEALLTQLQDGKLGLADIADKVFFSNLLSEVKNGYFADPKYGGNKDMGAWKMIGYPGMRADYIDFIGVRDKPYPLGPVDLAGRRG